VSAPAPARLWSVTADNGALTAALDEKPDGLALVLERPGTAPGAVSLVFDAAEVAGIREAADRYLRQRAVELCPWDHAPRRHTTKGPEWCVYCGRDALGNQVKDLTWLDRPWDAER